MKESIGGVSLFSIVIMFVLLFASYITLSINHSKAFNVKNEIVNIIKNQGGVCSDGATASDNNCENFSDLIAIYFREVGFNSRGTCNDDEVGFGRDGSYIDYGANNSAFCLKAIPAGGNSELPDSVYYQVRVFYHLDIPIFGSLFNIAVSGETARIYNPNECIHERYNFGEWC